MNETEECGSWKFYRMNWEKCVKMSSVHREITKQISLKVSMHLLNFNISAIIVIIRLYKIYLSAK